MIDLDRQHIYEIYKAVKFPFAQLETKGDKIDYKQYVEYCLLKSSIPYEKGRAYKMREQSGPNHSGLYVADFVCYSNLVVSVKETRDANPHYNNSASQLLSLQRFKLPTEPYVAAGIQIDFSTNDLIVRVITKDTWESDSDVKIELPEGFIVMSKTMVDKAILPGGNLSREQRQLLAFDLRKESGWKRNLVAAIIPQTFYNSLVDAGKESLAESEHKRQIKNGEIEVKDDEVLLTKELLNNARTPRGGFNARQTNLFGISYPLPHGWLKSLIGRVVPKELYYKFIEYGKPIKE